MVNIDYWLSMANKIQTKTSGTNHLEKQIENLKAEFQQANAVGHRGSRRAVSCRGRLRVPRRIRVGRGAGECDSTSSSLNWSPLWYYPFAALKSVSKKHDIFKVCPKQRFCLYFFNIMHAAQKKFHNMIFKRFWRDLKTNLVIPEKFVIFS